jgi:tight adherence protein B
MSPAVALTVLGVLAARWAWLGWTTRPGRTLDGAPAAPVPVPRSVAACCAAADVDLPPATVWHRYRACVLLAPAALLIVTGPPIAAVVLGALLVAPRLALGPLRRRRAARRDLQLAPFLERVASSIRSGRSVRTALVEVAGATEPPLGADLAGLSSALDHGSTLDDAVARWAERADSSTEVRLVAAALQLGAQAGGEVARAVDGVAATLRERREVRGEVVALATQARTSAALLVVAPVGFAALVSSIEPGSLRFLLGTPAGLACLTAGLALDAVGALWMQRIVGRTT